MLDHILNFPTGKRLHPFLPALVTPLERYGELTLGPAVRKQLLAMSPASIDRYLDAERRRLAVNGRPGTKRNTLLKHPIPVRTWAVGPCDATRLSRDRPRVS